MKYVSIFVGDMAGVLTSPSGIGLLVEGRYFAKNAPAGKKRVSRLLSPLFNVGVMFAVSVVETWKSVKDNGYAPNLRAIDVVESSAAHVVADVTAVAAAEAVIGLGEMGWDNEWVGKGYRSVVGAWTGWRERVAAKKEEARLKKEQEKEDKKKDENKDKEKKKKENIPLGQPELSLEEEIAAVKEAQKNMVENTLLAQLEKKKKEIDSLSLSSDKKKEMKGKVSKVMNDMKKEMETSMEMENWAVVETKVMMEDVQHESYLEQVESKMKSKMKEMSPILATEADDTRVSEESHLPSLDIIAKDATKNVMMYLESENNEHVLEMEAKLPKSILILTERVMQQKRKATMKWVEIKLMMPTASPDANMSPVTKAAVNAMIDLQLPVRRERELNRLCIIWDIIDDKMNEALNPVDKE
jgi:hypothetical protein